MRKLKFKSPIFVIIKLFERERERERERVILSHFVKSLCKL